MVTYKRPEWLHYALQSLIDQTINEWRAIVLDDSPEQEGRAVITKLSDERIVYQPNQNQLGAARNIDQAFNRSTDAKYACILEDDHWFYPKYLEDSINILEQSKAKLLIRDLDKWSIVNGQRKREEGTTIGNDFSHGLNLARELHFRLSEMKPVSNASYFWDQELKTDLVVGGNVNDANIQEYLRSVQIEETFFYSSKALSVWCRVDEAGIRVQYNIQGTRSMRAKQSIKRYLYKRYGKEMINHLLTEGEPTKESEFLILDIPVYFNAKHFSFLSRIYVMLRGILRLILFQDPLRQYFRKKN